MLSGSLFAALMLGIREYLMMNKYKAGDGERSSAIQTPDLFPLMMYIYYAVLFLAVLSNFTKSHALRLMSNIQCALGNPYLLNRQYARKKIENVQCLPIIELRRRSNRVGCGVQSLTPSPASREHEQTKSTIFRSALQPDNLELVQA